MPLAARNTDDMLDPGYTDHTIIEGSVNVFVEGLESAREEDSIGDHILIGGGDVHSSKVLDPGSETVFINGLAAIRLGDAADCGSTVVGSAETVYIGG
jgi:uncharacterized Zn-binding protein involved in type VI secretion